jgi:hypothetical protein
VIDTSEFDLVADGPTSLGEQDFQRIQYLLLEFQPARRVLLADGSPVRFQVVGFGGPDVAPGILAKIEEIAGASFHVEVVRAGDPRFVCPRCTQDHVENYRVIPTGERLRVCPECEATWTAGQPLDRSSFVDLSTYLAAQGLTDEAWVLIERR